MVQARVRRNDARILASTVAAASSNGWSGISLTQVGKGAGLTIQPVRSRYPSRESLAAAAWTEVAGPALQSAMSDTLASAGLLDRAPSEAEFSASMSRFAVPSVELRAAAEMVVVSSFEPVLREAVDATIVPAVRSWLDPDAAGGPVRAARRGYVLTLALGLLAAAFRPGIGDLDFAAEWRRLLAVLGADRDPVPLPDEPRPPHLAQPFRGALV